MKNLLLALVISALPILLSSQVRVVPEIGFNYHPYTLENSNSEVSQNNIDFLVGVSGYLPFKKDWYFTTRIEYITKKTAHYVGSDGFVIPTYLGYEYRNRDLNLLFGVSRRFKENSLLSIGIDLKHRLISEAKIKYIDYSFVEDFSDYFIPILDLSYERSFGRLNARFSYLRILKNENFHFQYHIHEITGFNGLRFTLGYNLGKQ